MADPKDIGTAQKGTVARHLLGELNEPLLALEREEIENMIQSFRGGEIDYDKLLMHVANVSAARKIRERLESQVKSGQRAGQRL